MSGKWRVYNHHPQGNTHREKFRDDMIVIEAGKFILMDYEDAVLFKGQYFPMKTLSDGTQDPESYKCIKIEADGTVTKADTEKVYVCHLDGKEFTSAKALTKHMEENYAHLETVKNLELDAELEKQAEAKVKRKPGPKPKNQEEKTL